MSTDTTTAQEAQHEMDHPRKGQVDRVACPWLIKKFVDKDAEFVFVPGEKVMGRPSASTPFPTMLKTSSLGHHGKECSLRRS